MPSIKLENKEDGDSISEVGKDKTLNTLRGIGVDYTSLKLTQICPARTKIKVNKLVEQMKPGLSTSGKGDCVKEAIRRGFLDIKGSPKDLKKIVFKLLFDTDKDLKEDYDQEVDVTLEMLLNQPNQAGGFSSNYYIPANTTKAIRKVFLSGICSGNTTIYTDTRHCVEGNSEKTFGTCINSTEKHCKKCDIHFGEEVEKQEPQDEDEDEEEEEECEEEQEEDEQSDYCYMGSDLSSSYDSEKHHMYFMGACLHDNNGPPLSSSSQSLPSSPLSSSPSASSSSTSSSDESSSSSLSSESASSWSTVSSWYTISPSSSLSSISSIPNLE